MRFGPLVVVIGAALILSACGKSQTAAQNSTATSAASTSAAPSATAAPGATKGAAQLASAKPEQTSVPQVVTRTNEDGSETVEDTSGDSGTHNSLLSAVASTAAAATVTNATDSWTEGVNYTRLVPAQPTNAPAGQVEVLEFFWYACPHCYAIDPLVESWKKTKPPYVTFTPVHVMWNDGHRSLARMHYALDSMGKLDQLHPEIFKAIHLGGNMLVAKDPSDTAESERIQTAFVQKFGISAETFKKAYHSFGVETNLQRADELVQRYRVAGVPTFVVNGKFVADVATAGGPERLLSLVSDLSSAEHKH